METHLIRTDEENLRHVEGVRLLLDAGMDPNQSTDSNGGSTFVGVASYLSQRESSQGTAMSPTPPPRKCSDCFWSMAPIPTL